jgi:predicted Zn-dependent protease
MVFLASIELKLGKLQKAEWIAQQAIVRNPAERGAHMMLGAVCLERGDPSMAIREFSAELQLSPEDPSALQALQVAREQLAHQNP